MSAHTDLLTADTTGVSEARPRGVPAHWDWGGRGRIAAGTNPDGRKAFVPWAQVYADADGNPQPAARVEVIHFEGWMLGKAGGWVRTHAGGPIDGAWYREDFAANLNVPATNRVDSPVGVCAGVPDRHNFHFWPRTGRVTIDPANVVAVVCALRARLDPASVDPSKPAPRLLLSVGADYWRTTTARWEDEPPADLAISRFKRVDSGWRTFGFAVGPAASVETCPAYTPNSAIR